MPSGKYKRTKEHIDKIVAFHKGRKRSIETKNTINKDRIRQVIEKELSNYKFIRITNGI